MDLEWLRDTLAEPVRRDRVYWATAEGITSTDWSPDAKRWLHLITRRIRPSRNRTDVTFLGFGGGVCYTGYTVKCGGADHLRMEDVLRGQQEGFLLTTAHYCVVQAGGRATF
uniref:Uncharacterized protein n=1 Tax=Solanum tuberosum TaxID=4113 RepID=M1DXF4_SOLTU